MDTELPLLQDKLHRVAASIYTTYTAAAHIHNTAAGTRLDTAAGTTCSSLDPPVLPVIPVTLH